MTLSDERIQEIAVQAGLRCREELSREASRLVWTPPTCVIASAIRQAVAESHAAAQACIAELARENAALRLNQKPAFEFGNPAVD